MAKQENVGEGTPETGGLPRRINKATRRAEQARAAQIERDSFSVPDRPGRPKNSTTGYESTR